MCCVAHHIYRKSLHNYAHPRTDAVVIMIAVDDIEDKVLLGRGVSPVLHQNTPTLIDYLSREGILEKCIQLSQDLLNLASPLKMQSLVRYGRRRA